MHSRRYTHTNKKKIITFVAKYFYLKTNARKHAFQMLK